MLECWRCDERKNGDEGSRNPCLTSFVCDTDEDLEKLIQRKLGFPSSRRALADQILVEIQPRLILDVHFIFR
jgi:hypothetical protein